MININHTGSPTGVPDNLYRIFEALHECGIDEKSLEIGWKYLGMDGTAETAQLDGLKVQAVERPKIDGASYRFEELLGKAIDSTEMIERYLRFCYAIAGCRCWKLFDICSISYNKTFRETFPEDVRCAIELDRLVGCYSHYINHYICKMERLAPEVYLSAAKLELPFSTRTSATICILALDSIEEKNDTAVECIALLENIIRNNRIALGETIYKTALAECAYFDDRFKPEFLKAMEKEPENLLAYAYELNIKCKRLANLVISENISIDKNYIFKIMELYSGGRKPVLAEHLRQLVLCHENLYISAMKNMLDSREAFKMLEILQEVKPEYIGDDFDLNKLATERMVEDIYKRSNKSPEIYDYITCKKSFEEIKNVIPSVSLSSWSEKKIHCHKYDDKSVQRCIIVCLFCSGKYQKADMLNNLFGLWYYSSDEIVDILFAENIPVNMILELYINAENLAKYAKKIAAADISGVSADGRELYLATLELAGKNRYKSQIFAMAGDTSKAVRTKLLGIIPKISGCENEIAEMLSSKKSSIRETALEAIQKMPKTDWTDILTNALEKEKSAKLRAKMLELLGMEQEEKSAVSDVDIVEQLTKGSKGKKVAWLYESPYRPVRLSDGTEATEKYMKALLICYADGNYSTGKSLAEKLNADDLALFAYEVLGRWINLGAVAKNKWVLTFSAINGNTVVFAVFLRYIKEWSDNLRGALAVSAVKALALNGSPEALMLVDDMARKFKKNQVKSAAQEALIDAAEFLGITIEELGDRIVPDFGFDERMCRVFDYGERKFSVYLTPSLEIEIYNGDKKIKNLPKPGANDNAEIAEKSYAEFKEMKKQLKTAVKLQTTRLEYTLMCDRKWAADNWKKLFVKNPLMHCFAVGLIWGVYEGGRLVSAFRYLDDGSFTTADEDEFEIPENAQISLVHPVELAEEELSAWTEQLEDYEITQPFAQLSRPVFRPEADELNETEIKRFADRKSMSQTLASRMEKNGWYRGCAGDAGYFYDFGRQDVSRKVKINGKDVLEGYGAELSFSGVYIGVFQVETEEVTIENLSFYDVDSMEKIPVSKVSDRYFSEVVMQLSAIL
ncbi:MAG: DUF4132 domain-containing protein [Ruminococcus flavefaciens]|nr:DUF4132 domain-containing protein [Ruminococcus flavefaciens]MCM1229871.1 DUF4132 domain-containing protein [Ruminococcus flavefaciens]